MLNPRTTSFLNPMETKFQSGKITDTELVDINKHCSIDQDKIAMFTKLSKHMATPVLNEMAQRLYDMEATQNGRQPLRTDNLARAFARSHFERLLGNDKQRFIDAVIPLMLKSDSPAVTFPVINSQHLKDLLPTLNNLIKCAIDVAEDKQEKKELEEVMNKIKNDKPNDDELKELLKERSKLIMKIEDIHKKAISDLISFNIIKPYVNAQLGEDTPIESRKSALKKSVTLDGTLTTQLYENYKKLQSEAPSVKLAPTNKEEKPLKPPAEGPPRNSLRR